MELKSMKLKSVKEEVWISVYDQIWVTVHVGVRDQVERQVRTKVWVPNICNQVRSQVETQINET